jgi:hypothetical protein
MTEDWRSAGTEFYEEILDRFDNHSDWEYDDRRSRDEAVQESAEAPESTRRVEHIFTHSETGDPLLAGIPDLNGEQPVAVRGRLSQARSSGSYPESDELGSLLKEAQGAVAERAVPSDEQYVTPAEDMNVIATVQVPFDYEGDKLDNAVDTLSRVAEDVDEMYGTVFDELDHYRRI